MSAAQRTLLSMPSPASLPTYVAETFTPQESAILSRYFTNIDGPVFCLVNMPEVVKGALFARYSRTPKSLRRLFLDEFAGDLEAGAEIGAASSVDEAATERASNLYTRVFGEYGDDSVAQLGFVHLACEQASIVLTKLLEWGRLAAYLEQSTRYIAYTDRLEDGRYRYYRAAEIGDSELRETYLREMDTMFSEYSAAFDAVYNHLLETTEPEEGASERAWKAAARAKALDACRGMLPAGTVSNLGIAASGQAFEQLILRLRSHPLEEARAYAELMLTELRKVIPDFLSRLDRPERGGVWVAYLEQTREATAAEAAALGVAEKVSQVTGAQVELVDYTPEGERKLLAAALYPQSQLSLAELEARAAEMSEEEKARLLAAYVGERLNRRHKPGRAFERVWYEFDIVCDYGAFRDLQRHRMCTIEWQRLGPELGYDLPELIEAAGEGGRYAAQMERSAELWRQLREAGQGEAAQYAVALAYRIRFRLGMNAREAMHLCELRSQPQGHISYRLIAQEIHRQIKEVAGHAGIADAMSFVDYSGDGLGRMEAEKRAEERRRAQSG